MCSLGFSSARLRDAIAVFRISLALANICMCTYISRDRYIDTFIVFYEPKSVRVWFSVGRTRQNTLPFQKHTQQAANILQLNIETCKESIRNGQLKATTSTNIKSGEREWEKRGGGRERAENAESETRTRSRYRSTHIATRGAGTWSSPYPNRARDPIGNRLARISFHICIFQIFHFFFFFRWFHSLTHSLTPAPVYLLCQHERGTQSESETERVRQGETRLPTAATKFRFFKLWRLCKRCRTGTRLICLHLATFAARFSRFCEGLVFYWQMENTALRSVFLGGHVGNVTAQHTFCTIS